MAEKKVSAAFLRVGQGSAGKLTVEGGEIAFANTSGLSVDDNGTLHVKGAGAKLTRTGGPFGGILGLGNGTLRVTDGAVWSDTLSSLQAGHSGRQGTFDLRGSGVNLTTTQSVLLGSDTSGWPYPIPGGDGRLTLAEGAAVKTKFTLLGAGVSGLLRVESGGSFTSTDQMTVGWPGQGSPSAAGTGTLEIIDGGSVTTQNGLSFGLGGNGSLTIGSSTASPSVLTAMGIRFGSIAPMLGGTGIGTVSAGGTINATGSIVVTVGQLNLAGGSIAAKSLSIGTAGVFNWTSGSLTLTDGGTAPALSVPSTGTLGGSGTIASVINAGTVSPGQSPGTLNISGDFTQADSGDIHLHVEGTQASGLFDQLVVGGAFTADGDLVIDFGSIVPKGGDVYQLISASGMSGAFDRIQLTGLHKDMLMLTTSSTGVSITVVPEPATLGLVSLAGLLMRRRRSRHAR